jgi:photosystem II stability/assembly factor-like uncharacterized protein
MKNLYFLGLLVACVCASLSSHSQCFAPIWHNPLPQGNDLEKAVWLTPDTALTIGDRGALVRTVDGGDTWEALPQLPEWNYLDMFFTDALTGYACGNINTSGIIIKTTDGGDSWTTLISGGIGTLGGAGCIWFTDANTGYCGTFGAIYRTTDAGATWTNYSASSFSLTDIFFQDANNGWAIANSRILRTTNGGLNWTQVLNGGSNLLSSIIFTDANNGYAATNNLSAAYYRTTDGGSTWTLQTVAIAGAIQDMAFVDTQTGYACSSSFDSYIYKTTDAGNTWALVYTLPQINRLHSLALKSTGEVLCVGNAGAIIVSLNNGNSGTYSNKRVQLGNGFFCMDMVSDNTGYFGAPGAIWKTTDGGNTLASTTIPSGTRTPLSMHFPSADTGYVVGSDGMRYRTYNGGNTWTNFTINTTNDVYGVYFLTNTIGYTCGEGGSVGKTTDGWATISPLSIGVNVLLYDVFFLNESHGYVCGANGAFYRTVNGGQNWTAVPTGTTTEFMLSVYFPNDTLGFCSGNDGRMLRTTDGGETWTTSLVGFGDDLYEVLFVNENEGYYITGQSNGTIYRTWNGGLNWQYWGILSNSTLLDFDITPDGSVYAVGFTAALWEVNPITPTPNVPSVLSVCEGASLLWEAPEGFITEWYGSAWGGVPLAVGSALPFATLNNASTIWVSYVNIDLCRSIRVPINISYTVQANLPFPVVTDTVICPGETTTISTSDGSSVQWNTGFTGNSLQVSNAGWFSFEVETSECGLIRGDSVRIDSGIIPEAPVLTAIEYSPCDSVNTTIAAAGPENTVWFSSAGEPISVIGGVLETGWLQETTTFQARHISEDGCLSPATDILIQAGIRPVSPLAEFQNYQRCTGTSVNVSISSDYEVIWNTGASGSSIVLDEPGTYSAQNVQQGCISEPAVVAALTWSDPVQATLSYTSITFCAGDSIEVSVAESGEVTWSTGSTAPDIWVTQSTSISAVVTTNGCTGPPSEEITLTEENNPEPPTLTFGLYNPCEETSITLDSNNPLTQWYTAGGEELVGTGDVFETPVLNASTTFAARIVSENGCIGPFAEVFLPVTPLEAPLISTDLTAFCDGGSTQLIAQGDGDIVWNNGAQGNSIMVTESGPYFAFAENELCTAGPSNAIDITVWPVPPAPAFTLSDTLLIITNGSDFTAAWSVNGEPLAGAANDTLSLSGPAATYTAQLLSAQGCTSLPSTFNYIPDGIMEEEWTLVCSPNPTQGFTRIEASQTMEYVKVIGIDGKTVFYSQPHSAKIFVDVSEWSRGIYVVEVKSENGALKRILLVTH